MPGLSRFFWSIFGSWKKEGSWEKKIRECEMRI